MCLVSPYKIKNVSDEPILISVGETEYSFIDTTLDTCIARARQLIVDQNVDAVKVKFDGAVNFGEEQTEPADKAKLTLYKREKSVQNKEKEREKI